MDGTMAAQIIQDQDLMEEDFLAVFVKDDCKTCKSEYFLAGLKTVSEQISRMQVVNCTAVPDFCAFMEVLGYPAVRTLRPTGIHSTYHGPFEPARVVSFARSLVSPIRAANVVTSHHARLHIIPTDKVTVHIDYLTDMATALFDTVPVTCDGPLDAFIGHLIFKRDDGAEVDLMPFDGEPLHGDNVATRRLLEDSDLLAMPSCNDFAVCSEVITTFARRHSRPPLTRISTRRISASPLFDPHTTPAVCVLITAAKPNVVNGDTTDLSGHDRLEVDVMTAVELAARDTYHLVPFVAISGIDQPYFASFCEAKASAMCDAYTRRANAARVKYGVGRDSRPQLPCVMCYRVNDVQAPQQQVEVTAAEPSRGAILLLKGSSHVREEVVSAVHAFTQR
ncbi:protein disulfide-isomerase [Carpediemonas membranifera]|uniref:Protein disulfide-isomerase n=1 Tax=Carpediemonas membranifera TaxID=201153 RepID=A0A8J6APQ8_9EUKA|nr:protein disulfide-isomerase [Carpediemonas membranifera]|eukprot:KAG9390271.1 protein disulfide-isomerase [Carpediemonas membranifera]